MSGFDKNAQIEFMNNKIKIRRADPSLYRDHLILKSSSGALLGLCSVMCVLFSIFKLLPAIYQPGCHTKHTWSMSKYPGASFALFEALTSLAFLSLLVIAALLSAVITYVPIFFLRTIPSSCNKLRRRLSEGLDTQKAWKPNAYQADYYGLEA